MSFPWPVSCIGIPLFLSGSPPLRKGTAECIVYMGWRWRYLAACRIFVGGLSDDSVGNCSGPGGLMSDGRGVCLLKAEGPPETLVRDQSVRVRTVTSIYCPVQPTVSGTETQTKAAPLFSRRTKESSGVLQDLSLHDRFEIQAR